MPVVPFTPGPKTKGGRQLPPPPAEPFALMAAAQIHSEGRLLDPEAGPPMDITSQAQKSDMQRTAKDWPEGTSPEVKKIFNERLKAGDITKDQYMKAMQDPRQFQVIP